MIYLELGRTLPKLNSRNQSAVGLPIRQWRSKVNNNSGVLHQPINVDGTVTQCVITFHFSPSPTTSPNQSSTEAPDGKLLLRINDRPDPLKRIQLKNQILDELKEGRNAKKGHNSLMPNGILSP